MSSTWIRAPRGFADRAAVLLLLVAAPPLVWAGPASGGSWVEAGLLIGQALAFFIALGLVCRRLRADRGLAATAGAVGLALGLAFVTAFVCAFIAAGVALENNLCGDSGVAAIVAYAAYLAMAAVSFARPRWLLLGWPLAVVAGLAVFVASHAVIPGGHGHCDYFN
jgi:hypothetical protein